MAHTATVANSASQHSANLPSQSAQIPSTQTPSDPNQESNLGGAPPQFGFPARGPSAPWSRWRPEELGTFDPDKDNVYTFVGRIREVADLRDSHMIQLNLSLQLLGKAKKWFELELSHQDKSILYTPANGVNAWIDALINKFQPSGTELLQKLHETSYTTRRADAAAKKDLVDYIYNILSLTRTRPLEEGLMKAYLRFESLLQINLMPLSKWTTVPEFMDQINAKKIAWFMVYFNYRKRNNDFPDQHLHANTTANAFSGPNYSNIGRQNPGKHQRFDTRPGYQIRPGLDTGNGPGNPTGNPPASHPGAPKYTTTGPGPSQVYHDTPKQERPAYAPSQSHTPHTFDNTHDDDPNDYEEVYHVDHDHSYNMINYPHRHND